MKKFLLSIVFALGILCSANAQLPSVTLKDINGKTVRTDTLSNNGKPFIIDFFATWCQPCKAMHPILEQVKSVLGDRIRIIKVDVDKYGVTASQYRIQSVPTLMLFRNGEVLWRTSGVVDKAELLATLDPFLI